MRALLCACVVIAISSIACVKGDPESYIDAPSVFNGGSIAVPGCGYTFTTYMGAETPQVGTQVFGSDSAPEYVHLSLVTDPKTSVVASWRTPDESTLATTIRLGVGANLDPSALTDVRQGITFQYLSSGNARYRMHQAHVCGLSPGTTYSYQVGGTDSAGVDHFSSVFTFHTAPDITAHPDAQTVFAFVGDSRGGYDVWQQLVTLIQSRSPDLVLFSGDAVTFGFEQNEWETFFGDGQSLFASVPFVSANGNHEDNAVNYFSQIPLPADQQNFGLDYGYAHITVGNDTPENPTDLTTTFVNVLNADMTASDSARWKLFMHHQPIWSASTKHGSSVTLQQSWQPIIDAHHIDLVLNGHDHDFELTKPMLGQNPQSGAAAQTATVYVVAGGAGAELYPNGSQFWTQYSESTYSAAIITISQNMLTFDPFHPDGSPITAGQWTKTKD